MAFQPLRMANSTAFTSMLDPNINAELTADMASKGLGALAKRRANQIVLDAQGGGGGFGIGDALSLAAGGLSMAKGLGAFGGGAGKAAGSLGSVAQANGVTVKPGFYGPAF